MDEWLRFAPAAKLLEERERDVGRGGGLVLRDSASSCCRRAFAFRRLISWAIGVVRWGLAGDGGRLEFALLFSLFVPV